MARGVTERFGGEVPTSMEDLTSLPGVGRKTANVVRSVALGLPGLPVDTHVGRLTRRLGLTEQTDPVKVESEVGALVPPAEWGTLSLRLILHGRKVCRARTRAAASVSSPTSVPRRWSRCVERPGPRTGQTDRWSWADVLSAVPWKARTPVVL